MFLELGAENCSISGDESQGHIDDHDYHYLIASYGCPSQNFSAVPRDCDSTYQELLTATQIVKDLSRKTSTERKMVTLFLFEAMVQNRIGAGQVELQM